MAEEPAVSENGIWTKWHSELELSGKVRGYKTWESRGKKIIRRYRDERGDINTDDADTYGTGGGGSGARFNILWSNIQTLLPALFAKTPKPVVERRYLDRDDVGRTASVILERALCYELDNGTYQSSLRKSVLDRLLPGRGVCWVRYEPRFSPMPEQTQPDPSEKITPETNTPAKQASQAGGQDQPVNEEVAYECAPVDYVDWCDFKTSPSRTWEEVWWVDKIVYMSREQLVARFGEVGSQVPLDWSPDKAKAPGTQPATGTTDAERRAKIHETWCKTDRKVYWWADGWSDQMLDEKDDPLKLEGFWPCPKPLYATMTNDSLIPVADFYEYQDQAAELDDLTTRITNLTKTIKACGVYDASVVELQRMFEEGFENQLVPCDNMAEFSAKAGASGMSHIWLLPVKDMVFTLNELYKARDQVKQSLYEITGISDIVRGQATDGAKTATEQRIKGQFASMRLNEMQADVARFARDILRIMGEIIAEHYDPMTLYLISGYEQYAKEQFKPDEVQAPPQQQGMPPPEPMVLQQMQQQAVAAAQKKAAEMFKAAVELLRNDKLRGFRIDIETDSLIEPDQQQTQQARTELLGAISQFLPQAMEAANTDPAMKPLMARLLMFFLRGFKASRDIESAFEQFIDDVTKEAANPKPKPPTEEEIKAKAEMQKQAAETQRMQQQQQIDQQNADREMAMKEREAALEERSRQQEYQHQERMLALKEREAQMKFAAQVQTTQIEAEAAERDAALDDQAAIRDANLAERTAKLQAESVDHKHQVGMEVMEAKAKQAKKPNGEARK